MADDLVQNPPVIVDNPPKDPIIPGDDPTKDFEARFKGLQRAYQQLQGTTQTTIATLTRERDEARTQTTQLQSTLQTKEGELTNRSTSITNLTQQLDEEKKSSGKHLKEKDRLKLILSEFSDLSAFETAKDGSLLPDADTPEDLRAKLTAFRAATNGLVGKGVQSTLVGATPPGAPPSSSTTTNTESEEYIWDQMAANTNKPAEFKKWQAKWDAIQEQKKTKK